MEYNVILKQDGGMDLLIFVELNNASINMNLEDQSGLQDLYIKLISHIVDNTDECIVCKLEIADDYKNNLFIDISKAFIEQLNNEIIQIRNDYISEVLPNLVNN